eukprot:jgi/Tetstr1/438748/TSEL_002944.t1
MAVRQDIDRDIGARRNQDVGAGGERQLIARRDMRIDLAGRELKGARDRRRRIDILGENVREKVRSPDLFDVGLAGVDHKVLRGGG